MVTKKIGLILLVSILATSCYYAGNKQVSKRVFNELIGTFILDSNHTYPGRYGMEKYKDLQITFTKDSSFYFNKKVPFIYDSVGKWIPTKGGLEDWNWLFYKSNPNISTQFTEVSTVDSIFYMNSVTPQKGEEGISVIYFKKLH